jgi:hypothetical protein
MLSLSSIKIYTIIKLDIIGCLMDEKVILDKENYARIVPIKDVTIMDMKSLPLNKSN